MDNKKIKADASTVTRDLREFESINHNLYEAVVVISKRANQIASETKEELTSKLSEFVSMTDNLEEIFENREQIEISKHYEHLPKPVSTSIREFLDNKVYFRNPSKLEEEI